MLNPMIVAFVSRNKSLENKIKTVLRKVKLPENLYVPIYIFCAFFFVLYEEITINRKYYKSTQKMIKICEKWGNKSEIPKFHDLTILEQEIVKKYFESRENRMNRRLQVLAMEASIQL